MLALRHCENISRLALYDAKEVYVLYIAVGVMHWLLKTASVLRREISSAQDIVSVQKMCR